MLVRVFENNGGMIIAIVFDGEKPVNILTGFEDGSLSRNDFIEAAENGFEYADEYNADDFNGLSIEEATAEIEEYDDLIAEIDMDNVYLYKNAMGTAGRLLFNMSED